MPEIGEQSPLNPLYPVNPAKPPLRREKPKPTDEKPQRKPKQNPKDEDDGKPHIDEYA
ncbi:MAG: hypothetical protein KZQ80_10525 [Candidatus Thiodiazotropha sp. (ex Monitilora ramsayi)]|nr:hypothetical protein [Candidatus Thiodiazotropha sp. (ex Monitilora ramsayi)]